MELRSGKRSCSTSPTALVNHSFKTPPRKKQPRLCPVPAERNPILNPVVLSNLFEVCELADLRRFRLVCKLWRDLSLQRWRDEVTVYIEDSGDEEEDFEDSSDSEDGRFSKDPQCKGRERLNWNNMSGLYESPSFAKKPYRKFYLKEYELLGHVAEEDDEIEPSANQQRFWDNCGPGMHYLHLEDPEFESENQLLKVIFEQTPNLRHLKLSEVSGLFFLRKELKHNEVQPNLTSLSISLDEHESTEMCARCCQLIAQFPNLQKLEWTEHCKLDYARLSNVLDQLNLNSSQKKVGRKLDVVVNNVNGQLGDAHMVEAIKHFLGRPQLRIIKLGIRFEDNIGQSLIGSALELHDSTLSTLAVANEGDSIPENILEACRRSLKHLKIGFETAPNFHFLEFAPNLNALYLNSVQLRQMLQATSFSRMGEIKLLSVENFKIRPCRERGLGNVKERVLLGVDVKMFVQCMPNLKIFEGPLSNESFREICEGWKELRELYILDSYYIDDAGITGLVPDEETRLTNITDLKYLRKFVISSRLLADGSVWNGFLQLDYLHSLEAHLSAQTSDAAFSALFKKFPSANVTRIRSSSIEKQRLTEKLRRKGNKLLKDFGIGQPYQTIKTKQLPYRNPWNY